MDYSQLAQAKAEKKYPYKAAGDRRVLVHPYQQRAYIDALNDVRPIVEQLIAVIQSKAMWQHGENEGQEAAYCTERLKLYKSIVAAIEQFEKIESGRV